MQQSLSVQNNRYIKQTTNLPAGLTISTQSYQTIPNYIPSVPVKNQVSTTPYGAQKLANTTQASAITRKWDDIITNPTLTQTVLKTSESTITFRSPTNGRKLSNKELLAKADLILARSPKKFENLGAPSLAYINTISSPAKVNMPLSHPTSISREINSLQLNNYGIHENVRTTAPAHNVFTPPQILSPSAKEKLDEVVNKIIRGESPAALAGASSPLRQETYVSRPPIETQIFAEHRPVSALTSALRGNPYLNSQSSGAQRGLSELSEIQRDFLQLKIDSQKSHGLKDTLTPTPFISGYGNINVKASSFGAELLDDDEHRLESDRESRKDLYVESLPKKEVRINRYINPNPKQQEAPVRVFRLEEQSGRSQVSRNPYRKAASQSREGELVTMSKPRDLTPENNHEIISSDKYRGVKQTTERNRITSSSEYMVEIGRQEDAYIRRSIAIEEELKRREQQEKMAGFSARGGQQVMLSPKSEGVVLSPSNEYASSRGHGESGENWRRERTHKFSNKVEVSVEVRPDMVGKAKQPRVMSKTEKFFG